MTRRYDIDWIRVIAIGLLLIYHIAIAFQPWGIMIGFITSSDSWPSLWLPMTMLNVWRIPLLFYVSGMGVYFAMQNRDWKELIIERGKRILIPFVFGVFIIVPVQIFILQYYYHLPLSYTPNPAHLWFLGNIVVYILLLLPLFSYIKKHPDSAFPVFIRRMFASPAGLLPLFLVFVLEVLIINPIPFELYAVTWHGFFIGLLAFFFGFCFVLSGDSFAGMILRYRWFFLAAATGLFISRIMHLQLPAYVISIESNLWIITVLAFGYRYLRFGAGKIISYLSEAAYPVYILHMIFLSLGSVIIFPLTVAVELKFFLLILFTAGGCFATYELLIRRYVVTRFLFGLKERF